jgi:hypothetical protein
MCFLVKKPYDGAPSGWRRVRKHQGGGRLARSISDEKIVSLFAKEAHDRREDLDALLTFCLVIAPKWTPSYLNRGVHPTEMCVYLPGYLCTAQSETITCPYYALTGKSWGQLGAKTRAF